MADDIFLEVLVPGPVVELDGQTAEVASFTAGPPGPPGRQGDPGPPGPPGQDGGSSSVFQYRWNTATTPPPANGQVRADPAAQKLWLSRLTDPDVDVSAYLGAVLAGDKIYVQDKDDSSKSATWRVTGDPIAQPTCYEFPVTLEESGGVFTNNMIIAVALIRQGPAGPPGPPGPAGGWVALTQAEYDALSPPDPGVLYVVRG